MPAIFNGAGAGKDFSTDRIAAVLCASCFLNKFSHAAQFLLAVCCIVVTPLSATESVIFPPGSAYEYSNPGMAALAYAITASLKGTPYPDVRSLLEARLVDPLGLPRSNWSIGYDHPYVVDGRFPGNGPCSDGPPPRAGPYEFFAGFTSSRELRWSRNIKARQPVFWFPGHCGRADVVYNPLVKRYMLALGYNQKGGWGLYDAPTPWGPWTTVFHMDYWGLGGTHGYRLPSRWIGPDADELALVLSGVQLPDITYDAFCVRRMKVSLRNTVR